jgi:radical SAM superfamily enzyme YgiQ (UPF0313 family)
MGDRASKRVLLAHPGVSANALSLPYAPWGALCLASHVERAGHETRVLELAGRDVVDSIVTAIIDFEPDVIGITGKIGVAARRMRDIVDASRATKPGVRIAVGGPLVASFPDPLLPLWAGVDAIFPGEAETSFAAWLENDCCEGGLVAATPVDLDEAGIPHDWPDLPGYVMPIGAAVGFDVPALHVNAGRGCTRRCGFCYLNTHIPGKRCFHAIGPERLVQDMDKISALLGVDGFCFTDDCFVDADRSRLDAILGLLRHRGAPYQLGCSIQLGLLEDDLLMDRMRAAGFTYLYVGAESGSADVRRRIGKDPTLDATTAVLQHAVDRGFFVHCSVGIGWPQETESEATRTIQLIDSLPNVLFDTFRYLPLPGAMQLAGVGASVPGDPGPSELPFMDFGDNDLNFTAMDAVTLEGLWDEALSRRDSRYARLSPQDLVSPPLPRATLGASA